MISGPGHNTGVACVASLRVIPMSLSALNMPT
jgi:hypothetical protein